MYRWPWRRFERLFKLHLLRKAREELRQMRDLRIAALDANSNFDAEDNKNAKQQRLEDLQEAYENGVDILYSSDSPEGQADPLEEDPLFRPIRQRAVQLQQEINRPLVAQASRGRDMLEAM